jgi:hypothetical protein
MVYLFLITDNQEYGRTIDEQIFAYFREQRLQVCDRQELQDHVNNTRTVLLKERHEDLLPVAPGGTRGRGACEPERCQTENRREITHLFLNELTEEEDDILLRIHDMPSLRRGE